MTQATIRAGATSVHTATPASDRGGPRESELQLLPKPEGALRPRGRFESEGGRKLQGQQTTSRERIQLNSRPSCRALADERMSLSGCSLGTWCASLLIPIVTYGVSAPGAAGERFIGR